MDEGGCISELGETELRLIVLGRCTNLDRASNTSRMPASSLHLDSCEGAAGINYVGFQQPIEGLCQGFRVINC